MEELRTVDISKGFECGGKKWVLSNTPSFARYTKLQELNIEFTFSTSVTEVFNAIQKVKAAINENKIFNASVALYNLERGISEMDKKHPVAFQMCALFINSPGEDMTDSSDEMINAKVDIWAKELDSTPFFHMAASICREWIAAYNVYSRSSSKEEQTKEKSTKIK